MSRSDELHNILDLEMALAAIDYDLCLILRDMGLPQWPWTYYWLVRTAETPPELHHIVSPLLANFRSSGFDSAFHDIIAAPTFPLLETLITHEWVWKDLGDRPDHQLQLYISRVGELWTAAYRSAEAPSDPRDVQHLGAVAPSPDAAVAGLIIAATREHPSYMAAIAARWTMLGSLSDRWGGGE